MGRAKEGTHAKHAKIEEKPKNAKKRKQEKVKETKVQEKNIKKSKAPKKKVKTVRKVKRIVTVMLLMTILAGILFLGYKIQRNGGGLTGTLTMLLGEDGTNVEDLEPIQVLIMGESGVDDYKLADTIMVASYNPKTQSASILSIPRDTYVGRKDRKTASTNYLQSYKINTVFRSGTNIPEAIDRINAITGLELENYVIIDTKALIKLVDAIGGVTFNVPIDMYYTEDTDQNLYIDLKAGEQLIDGAKAEQLLRFRHNNDGSTYPSSYGQQDLGRMRTQREFIKATLKQTLQPKNAFKIKQIMDVMTENVKTNMDISKLKAYIPSAVKFDADNIQTDMVPGTVEMCNGVSIYVANTKETKKIVDRLFNDQSTDETTDNSDENVENSTTNTNKTTKNSNTTKK